jgi:hypothetical protein
VADTMDDELLHTVYEHDPRIVSRLIAGEIILVPIRKNVGEFESIYTLNETAGRVWELIDGRRSVAAVLEQMLAEFEIDPDQAEDDLTELLQNLWELGALQKI